MRILVCLLIFAACDPKTSKPEPTAAEQLLARVKRGPYTDVKPDILWTVYQANSVAADREYKGSVLRVYGIVGRVGQDADGVPLVTLHSFGDSRIEAQTIRCAWGDERSIVGRFTPGEIVTLGGIGAGMVLGEPLLIACAKVEVAASEVTEATRVVVAKQDPDFWRRNLDGFITGKDVKNYKLTWSDEQRTQLRIDSDKCDRVRLGVEQIGSMPDGFKVECYSLAKDKALQWTLTEVK